MKFDNSQDKRSPALRLKFDAASGNGEFSGYASTYGGLPDSYGDVIAAGAYSETLKAHKAAGTMPVMLWAHDQARPIGRWLEMKEDAKGLFVRGQCNLNTTAGRDAHEHIKAGDVTGMSIGYRIKEYSVDNDTGIWTLESVELREVSVVALPANQSALITSKADLVDLMVKSGLPHSAARKVAAGGFSALSHKNETDDELVKAALATVNASLTNLERNTR
ncbi:HK97 family phage prohead protease [Devosia neptuniae]|uniref:HK97 family phage prohead protease n=1 Tax=Devosia neptuniae TaxID=191302 RepID=UPI0022AFFE12|nr:HK97 family phage prohead protease [Devosia neptuniae]MCZ4344494.1 HK97 family phage prohead protease [Devosia neptuniae]